MSEKRLCSLMSIIGYLLHTYKNPSEAQAVVFMDAVQDGSANGGTGKGIIFDGISKLRNTSVEDGKSFKSDSQFKYSGVNKDTELLVFDDVPRNFDFEKFFSVITEGITVERKYENKFYIPFEQSPKVIITTNYSIKGRGTSFFRRKVEFELSCYYNGEYTPEDEFGHLLFDDWDNEQWALFYNLMAYCIQIYLRNDIIMSEPININKSKLMNETCEEFVDFADGIIKEGEKLDKKSLFQGFKKENPEYTYKLDQRTFTGWIKTYAAYNNMEYADSHSNSIRYIILTKKPSLH